MGSKKELQYIKELRHGGFDYVDISKLLGIPKKSVKNYCQRHNLRYSNLGDKPYHKSGDRAKGKVFIDWNVSVLEKTEGKFKLVEDTLLDNGEHRFLVECTRCGSQKEASSITLRQKGIRCGACYSEECRRRREAKKDAEAREREWRKNYERGLSLVQMQMNFCECGRLLPFGVKVCDKCKELKRKARQQYKDHIRRIREGVDADKSISLEKLYERDHGVCYLCNKTCDWQDFQIINGNFIVGGSYPTVEHVKALCHGGTHTWDNVKLACFACNTKKGRKNFPDSPLG